MAKLSTKPEARIGWKAELAALAFGLLLGSAWQAAHANVVVRSPAAVHAPRS